MSNLLDMVDTGLRRNAIADRWQARTSLPGAGDDVVLDCTDTERFGLRGPGTIDWLATTGLAIPQAMNSALTSPCGTTVLRLGQQEVLLVAPPGDRGDRIRDLRRAWGEAALPAKGYDAYREEGWAWIVVSGPSAPAMMRRISMADLRPASVRVGDLLQTRALHVDVVISRLDHFGTIAYDIFFDIASAGFALDVLTETAQGLGTAVAFAALRPTL